MKILALDDEQRMLDLLEIVLSLRGYDVVCTTSVEEALHVMKTGNIDVVLLDVMMPEQSGMEVCQQMREVSNIPIIMLTARDEKEDILAGFEAGATDYVTKPFDEDILVARMQAVVQRQHTNTTMEVDGLRMEKENMYVSFNGVEIVLTPIEYRLLNAFTSNPNMLFSREQLKMLVYKNYESIDNRTVDSHIRNVRDKLRKYDFDVNNYLKTVHGYGYRWEQYE